MARPPLPDFARPPLTEVALSMQFEELSKFRVIHLGLLWDKLGRDEFPFTEEQPPVPSAFEQFGIQTLPQMPQIRLFDVPPMPRYFFVSKGGNTVIQVQQDRFTVNWRKRHPEDEYPRFEPILARFEQYAAKFTDFLRGEELGSIRVTQAELTYVNRIETPDTSGRIEKIVSVFSGDYSDDFLHDPEEVNLLLRFPIRQQGHLLGRLYIDSRSGTSHDTNTPLNMVLVARGKPHGDDIKAALGFFEVARKYIVSAFTSVTSKQMHHAWERTDNA